MIVAHTLPRKGFHREMELISDRFSLLCKDFQFSINPLESPKHSRFSGEIIAFIRFVIDDFMGMQMLFYACISSWF